MNRTHEKHNGEYKRAEAFYEKMMARYCGPGYSNMLRPDLRLNVKNLLKKKKNEGRTLLVHGNLHDVKCFRAECFNLVVRNNLTAVRTDDSVLVKLNFNEVGEIPDTTIEDVTELERPDFLWLDICTTKNVFIPHQIMRLIDQRDEQCKRTVIYTPRKERDLWMRQYESTSFAEYLQKLDTEHIRNFK